MGKRRQIINLPGRHHQAPIPNATRIGNMLYTSAIGPQDPTTGEVSADPAEQAKAMFSNIRAVVEAAGGTTDDIIHLRLLLQSRDLRKHIDPEWAAMFPDPEDRPARHAEQQEFGRDTLMQCEVVAVLE
jgi:enamine deaminase RidA (YjgF/YER057c/UK114 family)